jgi:hypothetical protein
MVTHGLAYVSMRLLAFNAGFAGIRGRDTARDFYPSDESFLDHVTDGVDTQMGQVPVPGANSGLGCGGDKGSECLLWELITFRREDMKSCHTCRLGDSFRGHDEEISTGFDSTKDIPSYIPEHAHIVQEADLCPIFGKLAYRE